MSLYLASFLLEADSAAAPAVRLVSDKYERARVSGAVTSQATHLPPCQGVREQPSGRLPSVSRSPASSFIVGKPAFVRVLWTTSLSKLCLMILPLLRRHARPWVPLASTSSPHAHG